MFNPLKSSVHSIEMQKPCCAKGFCYAKPQLFAQTGKAKSLAPLATQQLRVLNQETNELAIPNAVMRY